MWSWGLLTICVPDGCRGQDGYVDGSDAGMEASLQVGFKQGYLEGAAMTAPVGRLKGMLWYVLSVCVCVCDWVVYLKTNYVSISLFYKQKTEF